jgi:hypothetical protein
MLENVSHLATFTYFTVYAMLPLNTATYVVKKLSLNKSEIGIAAKPFSPLP